MRRELFQHCNELLIGLRIAALKPRHVTTAIVLGQRIAMRHDAGQKTTTERSVGHKTDTQFVAEREDLALDIPAP